MDRLWGMEVFIRVMECGSFSRAAESLDLANATVTSSLRNLEKHLGVTLIQRNTRHLHLTEEGRQFLPRCQEILKAVAQAESDVKTSASDIAGPLRIEAPFAIGQSLICPALVEFTKLHPGLSVSVTLTNHPQKLIERGTDVAIRMDRIEDADLVGRPVYEARHVVCGAPALVAAMQAPHPRDIDPRRCLGLFEEGHTTPFPWLFKQADDEVVIRPQGALNFNNTQALIQAALQEVGLIYVLDIFVADLIHEGKLVDLCPGWDTKLRTFHAVTVKSRFTSPKVRAFIDYLLEVFDARRRPSVKTLVEVGPGRKTKKSR
ncbi:LysR family transcriptional regulator [Pollutimonas bauzanensis]|uniref:LysR family transcriptional regulator, regulator for bpeEF and oprC n=1 Tax=Pollutimonas bauzanensis TaxID=658167 RepID=A0A1M5QWB7_9BURK|nr:LysR family transcriptional regulator [Pollutimonas bauzanensis]SHH18444.1 LysR family transcriptional regulator, regulator for bpeEF and oprC [Pollutimonas bauzanensis]